LDGDQAGDARSPFRRIGERPRFAGERLRVVTGTFVGPDGFTFEREIVRTFDAVCIVAIEADGEHALLVRQYRGAVDQPLLELPAGKLDIPGETPEVCAARELAEEVGMEAGELTEISRCFISPGFCDELSFCFLAEGLTPCGRAADGIEERHLVVERIALADVEELVEAGELADAKTIAGLLLARSRVEKRRRPAASAMPAAPATTEGERPAGPPRLDLS
jgi:8-oxo-dGTP pyrophosphatase MutT (NUDIX family)